jgi:very-short-patch-repair endonuclease
MAAVLACGPGAALSHFDAAVLWKIYDGIGPRVHVLAMSNRRVIGLVIHRARHVHPDDVTVREGIPVTTVERTLVDLTDVLGEERLLRAIREAEFLKLLDFDALGVAIERSRGRRHLRALKQALAHHRPRQVVRGELEHRFSELVRGAGLPAPETNVRVKTWRRVYTVDCLWREHGLAVELDGRAAHARTTAFEADRARDAALNAAGLRTLRFTWQRVTREPESVLAEVIATMRAAGRVSA